MSEPTPPRSVTGAQIIIEALYALLALGSIVLFGLRQLPLFGSEFDRLAQMSDHAVCVLFAGKAVWDFWRAPDRLRWWKWGWADVAASIPEVEILRGLRGLRLLRIIRVLRSTTRSVQGIVHYFRVGRAKAVVAAAFSLLVVSVVMSSFLILGIESPHPEANILTAEAALWWSIATTIGAEPEGFGNYFPVTPAGRVLSVWLVIVSLGLIGSLAGLIASWIEQEMG